MWKYEFGGIMPPSHWTFQCANVFLLLSYLSTNMLQLRLTLACASTCFILWAIFVLNVSLDTTIWNFVLLCINLYQASAIIYARRPVKFSRAAHEKIYT
jgi:hypothetical protein